MNAYFAGARESTHMKKATHEHNNSCACRRGGYQCQPAQALGECSDSVKRNLGKWERGGETETEEERKGKGKGRYQEEKRRESRQI